MLPQLFFALVLISQLSSNVNCYLQIHESSVWIPYSDDNISQPIFMWHMNRGFLPTQYSSLQLNTDPTNVNNPNFYQTLKKAYSLYVNSESTDICILLPVNNSIFVHFELNETMATQYNSTTSRWSTNRSRAVLYELTNDTTVEFPGIGVRAENISELILVTFRVSDWLAEVKGHRVASNFDSITTHCAFNHMNKAYSVGRRTHRDGNVVVFVSRTVVDDQVRYMELGSHQFREVFGDMSMVQFVASDYILQHGNFSVAQLLFVSYQNDSDEIVAFQFSEIMANFDEFDRGLCSFDFTIWSRGIVTDNPTCLRSLIMSRSNRGDRIANFTILPNQDNDSEYVLKLWPMNNYMRINLDRDGWGKIVDFVALAMTAMPGYLLLVLTANHQYTRYRFSIHYVDSDTFRVTNHPDEVIIPYNRRADHVKIYYHDNPVPQVLITIDQFHYHTNINLCPLLSNSSCLDCTTTKYFDDGENERFCQWTQSEESQLGTCSSGSSLIPKNVNGTRENSCVRVTDLYATRSLSNGFDMDISVEGYGESSALAFPFLIDFVGTQDVPECQFVRFEDSTVSFKCDKIPKRENETEGEVKLEISVSRIVSSRNEILSWHLATEPFYIRSSSKLPLIIASIFVLTIIGVIGIYIFQNRFRKGGKVTRFGSGIKLVGQGKAQLKSGSVLSISSKDILAVKSKKSQIGSSKAKSILELRKGSGLGKSKASSKTSLSMKSSQSKSKLSQLKRSSSVGPVDSKKSQVSLARANSVSKVKSKSSSKLKSSIAPKGKSPSKVPGKVLGKSPTKTSKSALMKNIAPTLGQLKSKVSSSSSSSIPVSSTSIVGSTLSQQSIAPKKTNSPKETKK
ncbi:uncharacterized protein LOC128387856 [Panonychus citri]|uniref:uncharacterized protein LOC128387856 n=1 Tax=Panonychus citri TaxID=50023 RepID=UPI002307BE1B|nr:uncharacterized protein LOC128387856 [Panonychus citri]